MFPTYAHFPKSFGFWLSEKKKKRKLQFNRLNFVILLPEIDLDEESFRDVPWINKDEDTEPAN